MTPKGSSAELRKTKTKEEKENHHVTLGAGVRTKHGDWETFMSVGIFFTALYSESGLAHIGKQGNVTWTYLLVGVLLRKMPKTD